MNDASSTVASPPPPPQQGSQARVLKNAMLLVVAQIVTIPISIVINAFMARYLGPAEFGDIYLATTFTAFAFLIVEWGQLSTQPAMVAIDNASAGRVLGTSLWWRAGGAVLASLALAIACWVLGYDRNFQVALLLVFVSSLTWSLLGACLNVIRGFERTDIAASVQVLMQVLTVALVIPTLLLGFRLRGVLIAQAIGALLLLLYVLRMLKPVGVGRLHWDKPTAKRLFDQGGAFLVLGLTIALQPNIDAIFLSKLASAEVIGWHAAARKLVGMLIFPASALVGALYPTLARLAQQDLKEFKVVSSDAISTATLLVVPVALGCFLYPDIGVRIFSRESFGPAEQNLQLLSIFVFLVYFSMVLGTVLTAAGTQRAWAVAQAACLVVSCVLDPLLIPWFQAKTGNGGLGLCIATNASELLMVSAGIYLSPPGLFNAALVRKLLLMLVSGLAMVVVAKLLGRFSPFLAAPIAVLAYAGALVATGALDREKALALKNMFARKLARR